MPFPRISLAAVAACCALAIVTGHEAARYERTVAAEPELTRRFAEPLVAPAPPRDAYADPAPEELSPRETVGAQQHFTPSPPQWENARVIVAAARERALPVYAAVIALATALQESLLENLTVPVDADSLGLFQQRPSTGWGLPEQLTDPAYAAGAFLDALTAGVPDYPELPLWQSAQETQASAFPLAYAQWEEQAAAMVGDILAE
ncbi:hypothetical protein [Nocardia blacklockiae]|uniref:hypothetical protein n=1 Tax=Nocardia blacklockiae TaxID=480036 RepID=UPI00189342E4|nr:hypothetical protein [Nocardia blacklockiae]MBF6172259.1 hypothetical protein [Nocardia blacklockiae]